MKAPHFFRLAVLVLLAACIGVSVLVLPVRDSLAQFLEWVRELGGWGPAVLVAAYVAACVLCIPGTILTLAAGLLFGLVRGAIAVSLGSTLGAAAAFLVGRTLARGWIEDRLVRGPRFRALDQAVAERGFKIVLLTRLSPLLPFNILNYAFGLTRVRFRDYLLASWIGMLPGTVMYVYLGTLGRELAELQSGQVQDTPARKIFFYAGLAATVVVTIFITRIARAALRRAVPLEEHP